MTRARAGIVVAAFAFEVGFGAWPPRVRVAEA
jgi:hypothetical protein